MSKILLEAVSTYDIVSYPEIGRVAPPKTPPQQGSSDPKPSIQTDRVQQRHVSSTSFSLDIFQTNSSSSHIYSLSKNFDSQVFSHIQRQHVGNEEDLYLQLYGS